MWAPLLLTAGIVVVALIVTQLFSNYIDGLQEKMRSTLARWEPEA